MDPPSITDEDVAALLSRLSSKQSVQSLLILSRATGSIIRASGAISRSTDTTAQEYASLVYRHVQASAELIEGLEKADAGTGTAAEDPDELRLLRLRTKRRELVVVPDSKFVLVVFHDTPPA